MKAVTRRRVENVIKGNSILPDHFEAEYEGRKGLTVVRHDSLDQINWTKVKAITVVYAQSKLVYKGYYEGDGNYNNAGPILKLEDRKRIS